MLSTRKRPIVSVVALPSAPSTVTAAPTKKPPCMLSTTIPLIVATLACAGCATVGDWAWTAPATAESAAASTAKAVLRRTVSMGTPDTGERCNSARKGIPAEATGGDDDRKV